MSAVIRNICFDAHDAHAQTLWWNEVLEDFAIEPGDAMAPGDEECGLVGADGRFLLFLTVPEGKSVKNRLHPCLGPGDRDALVVRQLAHDRLGADDLVAHQLAARLRHDRHRERQLERRARLLGSGLGGGVRLGLLAHL